MRAVVGMPALQVHIKSSSSAKQLCWLAFPASVLLRAFTRTRTPTGLVVQVPPLRGPPSSSQAQSITLPDDPKHPRRVGVLSPRGQGGFSHTAPKMNRNFKVFFSNQDRFLARTERVKRVEVLREPDSNRQSLGYEPNEIPISLSR